MKEFGIYEILLNPLRKKYNINGLVYSNDIKAKSFFLENTKSILIILATNIFLIEIIFWLLFIVTRYIKKY